MSFASGIVYEIKDWILWISLSIIFATGIGAALCVGLDTGTPAMAVVSNSMLHDSVARNNHFLWLADHGFGEKLIQAFDFQNGFAKGDVVIVQGQQDYDVGQVIVYRTSVQSMPIVHRIIEVNGTTYQTKGDHNPVPDPWKVELGKIEGKVIAVVPYVGFIKVLPMEALTRVMGK